MPKILGTNSADRWEREVRRQLAFQLPDDWIVVCNIAWALRSDGGVVKDGQCDFVVIVPGLGIAILEVKGSRAVRVGEDGIWFRREENLRTREILREVAIDEPPPEQACRNMHALARLACNQLPRQNFPGAYAFLVAYPNGVVEGPSTLYDPSTIISKPDIPKIARRIREAIEARMHGHSRQDFTDEVANRVAQIFTNSTFCVAGRDTPLDAREDGTSIDELTRQQFAALRGAFELPRVAIVGPAGSGKTLLAMWKLEALIEEGRRALYVCFNKALADFLRRTNPGLAEFITSVDRLFTKIADHPNGNFDANFFKEELPSLVQDVASELPPAEKYEAIIVDEGQDFGELRLLALLELLTPRGQWLMFADWGQNVYQASKQELLGAEVTFRLYHNCRNTQMVNSATNGCCSLKVDSMPGAPVGVVPKVQKTTPALMAAAAWDAVHDLAPEGGAVVLSPYRLEKSCMNLSRKAHGLQLTEDLANLGKRGFVLFSTVKSFKGLEAQFVVLVHADIPNLSDAFAAEDLYVACTRATGRFAIVTASDESARWFTERVSR
jgi:hypothetical protein